MTNKEAMRKMIKMYGVDAVVEYAKMAQAEIAREEEKYKSIISPYEYGVGRKSISFPDWVDEVFDSVVDELGISVTKKGSGDSCNMAITNQKFAKYVIYTCNDDGETLKEIIKVLRSAPAWCKGHGLTRSRMELVFHILVLHKKHTDEIVAELQKFLNKYEPVALKVFANADEAFHNTLNHEAQMIAFTERHICRHIAESAKFVYAA